MTPEKERINFIRATDKSYLSRIDRLQNKLFDYVVEFLETELIIKDNVIKSTNTNRANMAKLSIVQDNFREREINPLLAWMARRYIDIYRLNRKAIRNEVVVPNSVGVKVRNKLLSRLGLRSSKKGVSLLDGGFLKRLSVVEDPYQLVQSAAMNAIENGIPLRNLRKEIREAVTGTGRETIKHHFYTKAYDSFSQVDRLNSKSFADELGLRVARYSGGLIKTSRDFCEERNGQIFTIEEIEAWGLLEFDGKPAIYDPVRDLGGHNCRHTLNFISERKAIRIRPELKEYFENLRSSQ